MILFRTVLFALLFFLNQVVNSTKFDCNDNVKYLNPLDCTQYYICKDSALIHHKCPKEQTFDAKLETCAAADQVDCGTRLYNKLSVSSEQNVKFNIKSLLNHATLKGSKCNADILYIGHETDCDKFYIHECRKGVNAVQCPPGDGYDAIKKGCYPISEVDCSSDRRILASGVDWIVVKNQTHANTVVKVNEVYNINVNVDSDSGETNPNSNVEVTLHRSREN